MGGMNNALRAGHFTSSKVYKLIKVDKNGNFQAPGKTYIEEKQIEKRFQSCLDGGAHTQALAWGNFMELLLYDVLGESYKKVSKDTVLHPKYGDFWSGSADLCTLDAKTRKILSIAEIKCYQKKNFALYTDCLLKKDIGILREDFPKEYWQIVSNAIINDVPIGEGITFMPYVSEAQNVKDWAENYRAPEGEIDDSWKYKFIYNLPVEDLPFIPDGGYYKNINKFAFIIPEEDKELLTSRILQAAEILNS